MPYFAGRPGLCPVDRKVSPVLAQATSDVSAMTSEPSPPASCSGDNSWEARQQIWELKCRKRKLQELERGRETLPALTEPETVGNRFAPRGRFEQDRAAVQELLDKAERAQPKSTIRKPLYQDFGQTKALGTAW